MSNFIRKIILLFSILSVIIAQVPVTITSSPPGAKIKVNLEDIGTTPINNHMFMPGSYTIEVEVDGYAPIVKQIDLHQAQHLKMDFSLNQLYPVSFKSGIKGLEFKVSDQSWKSEKMKMIMEAGRHTIYVYSGNSQVDSIVLNVEGAMKYIYDPD